MRAQLEAILAETGKAFRLCRFYPAGHPAVEQALAGVSSALPALTAIGPVELKIAPSGFLLHERPLAPRNTQVQALAGLLYAQGHRVLELEPGVTADEVAALIRIAGGLADPGGGEPHPVAPLRYLHLGRTTASRRDKTAPRPAPPPEAAPAARRSFAVFRPDALPAEIEAGRLAGALEHGEPDAAGALARLGELLATLVEQGHVATLGAVVRAADAAARRDPALAAASGKLLDGVGGAGIAGLLARLSDAAVPADERDRTVQALGALGPRALGSVADRYLATADEDERDMLLAVVRRAGPAGAAAVVPRANPDARGKAAADWARLLGATGSVEARPLLLRFAARAEPPVRAAAVLALARLQDPEAARRTAQALRDADAAVRATAARGIAWYGDASHVPILLARLEEEEDQDAMVAIIDALGELRDPDAVARLAAVAEGVSGVFQRHPTSVRVAAIRALAAIGTPDAIAAVRAQQGSRRAEVREAAARALGGA